MTQLFHQHLEPDPVHAHFLARLPDLQRYAGATCRYADPQRRDDYVAEALAVGYVNCHSLVQRGRAEQVHTRGFLTHAVHAVHNGRHVGSPMASGDVMSERGRFKHGQRVHSLSAMRDGPTSAGSEFPASFEEELADSRTPVPDQVAFRIDFGDWLGGLTRRDRAIVEQLASGQRPGEVARHMHVSSAAVSQRRALWRESWGTLMGEPVTA